MAPPFFGKCGGAFERVATAALATQGKISPAKSGSVTRRLSDGKRQCHCVPRGSAERLVKLVLRDKFAEEVVQGSTCAQAAHL